MATSEFPGRFQHHDGAPDPEDPAFAEFAQLVERDPGAFDGWDGLEDWAADGNQPDPVARVYWRTLDEGLDESVATELAQRAVGFHEEWYGEDAPALIALLRKVLQIDEGAIEWAFPRLTVAYTSSEDWEGLLSLYDEVIERASDADRACSLLEEAIQAAKDFADAPDRAIGYLKKLLAHRPGDASLEDQIRKLLERQERWGELIEILRERATHETGGEAVRTRLEIAELFVDRAGDPASALAEARALLDSGDAGEEVTGLLERIAERMEAPDLKREALDLLRTRYAAEGRDDDVVRVLSESLEIAGDDERRSLHRDAARRLAQSGDAEGAFRHVRDALELEPREAGNRQLALEVADLTGDHASYVSTLAAVAEAVTDSALRAEYLLEAARSTEERVGDPERAASLYERVVGEPEVARDVARRALARLAEIHGAAGRKAEKLAALERASEIETDAASRRRFLFDVAEIARDLGDMDRALAALRARLSEAEDDREALDALIETLRAAERWEEFVEAVRRRVQGARSAFQARADLVECARTEELRLGLADAAIATWRAIAERFGEDGETVDALASLFESTERYDDLAELLDRTASREGDHLAAVRCRIGEVYERYLGRPGEATRAFAGALEGDPRSEVARAGLARLAENEEVAASAIEALAKAYLASEEWAPVLALLEQRLTLAPDDAARVVLLKEAASIQEERTESRDAALASLGRAFALAPADERIELEITRLGGVADDPSTLANAFAAAATVAPEPARRAHLRSLEGRAREERCGDPVGAFEAYREAFEASPTSLELARAVRRTCGEERREAAEEVFARACESDSVADEILSMWTDLLRETKRPALYAALSRLAARFPANLDLLLEALDVAPDEERERTLVLLYERAAGLFGRGAPASGEASAESTALDALDRVVGLLEGRGDARAAAGRLIEAARLPVERDVALSLRRRAAALLAGPADDPITAVDIYREVLRDAPDDVEAFDALSGLLERQGRLPELLEIRQREIESCDDGDRRIALRLDLARLIDRIEREGGRIEALRANLDDAPGHLESLEALEAVLRRYGRYEELAGLLEAQAAAVSGSTAAVLYERLADLAAGSLGDAEKAIWAYKKVVEIEPRAGALDALSALHVDRGEHVAAARWLERRLAVTGEDEKTRVSLALARALTAAGRDESVPEVLEAARVSDPANPELRELLAAHYRRAGAAAPLAALLSDATSHTEGDARLELAKEAAQLYVETLRAPAEAIPMLRVAAEIDPDDKAPRLQLAEALHATGRLDEAKEVLETLAGEFGRRRTPDRAQVHFLLGQVARAQGDLARALDELEKATKMAMSNAPMLAMLGRLAREAGDIDRSEKSYRTLLMLVRRRPAEDAVDVGVGEVLFELHDIASERGEAEKAGELLDSAFEAASQADEEALRFAEALSGRGQAELGLRGLELRLEADLERESKSRLLHAAAELLELKLGREADALARRLEALEIDARDAGALAATRRLARSEGRSRELFDLLERAADSLRRGEDAPVVASLRITQGEIAADDLEDTALASAALEKAIEVEGPHQLDARVRLARLARARGDRAEERALLETILAADEVPPRVEVEARYRLADIFLVEGEGEALRLLRSAYAIDPRAELALPVLRQLADVEGASDAVFELYEEVARGGGDDEVLLEFLMARSRREAATFEHLREAGDKALAMGRAEMAEPIFATAAERAELDGDKDAARWAYRRLAEHREATGDLPGAIDWLRRALATAEGEERREMQVDLAEMARRPGGDPAVAAELYRELLDDAPTDRAIYMPLLEILAEAGDDAGHADLVAHLLEALLDVEPRNEVRVLRARFLLTQPDRQHDAVEMLKDALNDQPEHAEAAELLGAIYEESGYDEELVELLRRKLDVAFESSDRETISTATVKLGALLEKVDREEALEAYRRAVDVVDDDRALVEALLQLLGDDAEEDERLHLSELLLGVSEGERASALARELLSVHEGRGDEEAALRVLERGFRANPGDADLRERLERHLRDGGAREPLASFLFVDAERLSEEDPEAAIARALEASSILREEIGRPDVAARELRVLVRRWPAPALVDELLRAYEAAELHGEALEEIGALIDDAGEGSARLVDLLRLRARLFRAQGEAAAAVADLEQVRAADAEGAVEELAEALAEARDAAAHDPEAFRGHGLRLVDLYEEAGLEAEARDALAHYLASHPRDVEALDRLRVADAKTENWPGVAWACARLVEVTEGEAREEAVLALCDASEAAGTPGEARGPLEAVLAEQPVPALRERLKSIYEASGAHSELAAMLLSEAAISEDDEARFELFRRAGELLVGVGDGEGALAALDGAHSMKPDDHRTVVALIDARMAAGRHAEAGALLEQAIENHPKRRSPELSELQHRMARLAGAAGDRKLEMDWLNQALMTDKQNVYVAAELAELSMELGELDVALDALRAVTIAKTDGPMSRAMAFLLQAKIARERGEGRRALLWARKARTEDPELEEAVEFLKELGES